MMETRRRAVSGFLQRCLTHSRNVRWNEVRLLGVALLILSCGYAFIELGDKVRDGETQTFDEWVLRSLRRVDAPGVPIGPPWLREAGLDVTALGGPTILLLVVMAALGLMWLQREYGIMILMGLATSSGWLVAVVMKYAFDRDRPSAVPHLTEVTTPSFPSGHAMLSAIVYLTIGILLVENVQRRPAKLYCLGLVGLITFLVGVSRIYLGVHYPTDVLAGWIAGVAWALAFWSIGQLVCRPRNGARS